MSAGELIIDGEPIATIESFIFEPVIDVAVEVPLVGFAEKIASLTRRLTELTGILSGSFRLCPLPRMRWRKSAVGIWCQCNRWNKGVLYIPDLSVDVRAQLPPGLLWMTLAEDSEEWVLFHRRCQAKRWVEAALSRRIRTEGFYL